MAALCNDRDASLCCFSAILLPRSAVSWLGRFGYRESKASFGSALCARGSCLREVNLGSLLSVTVGVVGSISGSALILNFFRAGVYVFIPSLLYAVD